MDEVNRDACPRVMPEVPEGDEDVRLGVVCIDEVNRDACPRVMPDVPEDGEDVRLGVVCIDEVNRDACPRVMPEVLLVRLDDDVVLLDRVEEDEDVRLGVVCIDEVNCDACPRVMLEELGVRLEEEEEDCVLLDRVDDDGELLDRVEEDELLELGEVCIEEVNCDACPRVMLEELEDRLDDDVVLLPRLDDDGELLDRLEDDVLLELGEVCIDEVNCDACDRLMLEELEVRLEDDDGVLLDRLDDDGELLDRFEDDVLLDLGEVCIDEVNCDACDRLMLAELEDRLEDDDGVLLVRLDEEDDEERLEELDEDDRDILHLKLVNKTRRTSMI